MLFSMPTTGHFCLLYALLMSGSKITDILANDIIEAYKGQDKSPNFDLLSRLKTHLSNGKNNS